MNKELEKLSTLCFKEKSEDFKKFLNDFSDFENFIIQYEKILLKWSDKEDFCDFQDYLPEHLFVIFGSSIHKTYSIDWSGEEYKGEIKKSLTQILKTYNAKTFRWNHKKFENSINIKNLKKGEYVNLLFRALDIELNTIGFQILFIALNDDAYHYTILPIDEISLGLELKNNHFMTYDSKLYEIIITQTGSKKSKLMLYLKNKLSIPLNEIKEYTNQLPIHLGCGNLLEVRLIEEEIKDLNCQYTITEK